MYIYFVYKHNRVISSPMQVGIHVVFTWNFPEHASRVISTLYNLLRPEIAVSTISLEILFVKEVNRFTKAQCLPVAHTVGVYIGFLPNIGPNLRYISYVLTKVSS